MNAEVAESSRDVVGIVFIALSVYMRPGVVINKNGKIVKD